MPVVVQKYGGSSVADIQKLRRVADHVVETRRAGHDVVVVVSAMGNTTDNLLELALQASASDGAGPAGLEPPRRELDMLLSTGERVSMALLSIAIQARGLQAISFTGSQSGIITTDRHFDARIIEVRPHRIDDELARGRIVIVAGYQGMSYRREITTLGRGGSDTTAVALAAALGAERCEIYSDVDGVYTADPRRVTDARHLPELDYAMMQEMSECGAKVLNAQAVEWAKRNRVVIHARRTTDRWSAPGVSARETVIGGIEHLGSNPRAVVAQRRLALLSAPAEAADEFLARAERSGLALSDAALQGGRFIACVPLLSAPDFPRIRDELRGAIDGLDVQEELGAVSLVGTEIGGCPRTLAAALSELAARPIFMLSTPLRLSCVIPERAVDASEQAWHARFVGGTPVVVRISA